MGDRSLTVWRSFQPPRQFSIYEVSEREREVSTRLREACLQEFARRDESELARLLGLHPVGLWRLAVIENWDLRVAFRVAERLTVDVASCLVLEGA